MHAFIIYTDLVKTFIINQNIRKHFKNFTWKIAKMNTVLLLVLMTISLTMSKPQPPSDSIVFIDSDEFQTMSVMSRFSQLEKECFKKHKVLFNDRCEDLLKPATCPDRQWLILDYDSAKLPQPLIRPKCVPKPCLTNFFYWPSNGKCYGKQNASALCLHGNMLVNDVFGDGTCQCIDDPPYGAVNNGTCYLLYDRGPCTDKLIFVEKENGDTECVPDKCYEESQTLPRNKTMVFLEQEKRCYQLGERGPCPEGKLVRIDLITKKPACAEPTPVVTLTLVSPPIICGTDHQGQCVSEIKPIRNDEQFVASLLIQADRKRNKRKLNIKQ